MVHDSVKILVIRKKNNQEKEREKVIGVIMELKLHTFPTLKDTQNFY